jgi:hypothetical protein
VILRRSELRRMARAGGLVAREQADLSVTVVECLVGSILRESMIIGITSICVVLDQQISQLDKEKCGSSLRSL